MSICKYCGTDNPSTVFNCLKCSALMSVAPVAVQPFPVAQKRELMPRRVQRAKVETSLPVGQPTKPTFVETSFRDLALYFVMALGFIGILCGVIFVLNKYEPYSGPAATTPPAYTTVKPAQSSSDVRTIKVTGGILVATTEENFSEMMSAAVAKDDAALMRMGVDGKLFRLREGTRVRIIDGGMLKSKVSALDGNQAGRSGWLPNEFIR